jgi:hypothetical protein
MRRITSVSERCDTIATFRHISVKLMEMAARWTPITPEMEAKVVFGRHIWDYAQMADWLGKRTFELRQPEHYTLAPAEAYDALLVDASKAQTTSDRVAALYDGVLPGLLERYRNYLSATDPILDEPSIVIIERILRELERQRSEADDLRREIKLSAGSGAALVARDKAIGNILAHQVHS